MPAQTATRSGSGIGLLIFIVAALFVALAIIHVRPSKPPHTPRPPAGPTNIRPGTNGPHR